MISLAIAAVSANSVMPDWAWLQVIIVVSYLLAWLSGMKSQSNINCYTQIFY